MKMGSNERVVERNLFSIFFRSFWLSACRVLEEDDSGWNLKPREQCIEDKIIIINK